MSFRILPDGTIEADTAEDALKVRAAMLRQQARQQVRRQAPESDELPENAQAFLHALVESADGLKSEAIAKNAGISTKTLPPLIRGLRYWAKRQGTKLDKLLLRRQGFDKGKPVSTYKLTEEGRARFRSLIQRAPAVHREMAARIQLGMLTAVVRDAGKQSYRIWCKEHNDREGSARWLGDHWNVWLPCHCDWAGWLPSEGPPKSQKEKGE